MRRAIARRASAAAPAGGTVNVALWLPRNGFSLILECILIRRGSASDPDQLAKRMAAKMRTEQRAVIVDAVLVTRPRLVV